MKVIYTTLFLLSCTFLTKAQPVVQNGNNIPPVGFSAPVSIVASPGSIGSPGANQTWDFSSYTLSPAGNLDVVSPPATPIGASFPTANYGFTLAGTYSFYQYTPTEMIMLASQITTPGVGKDYTPNPKTLMKFPFNYQDSYIETYQTVGNTPNSVTVTYDGYGTLITPNKTYTNVIRVKEDYSGTPDYEWYSLNPLMHIAVFDGDVNMLYLLDAVVNDVQDVNSNTSIVMYPNPTNDQVHISVNSSIENQIQVSLLNMIGQNVYSKNENKNQFTLNIDHLPNGIYFMELKSGKMVWKQKIVKQ